MPVQRKNGGTGRKVMKAAVRAGGLVVASSLLAGTANAKDDDRKAAKSKPAADSTMAVKTAPSATAADKMQPGGTMAWKLAPNSKAAKGEKAEKVNPPKGS